MHRVRMIASCRPTRRRVVWECPTTGSALQQPSHIAATIGTEHESLYQQTRYFAAGRAPLPLWCVLLAKSSHHRLALARCIASAFSFRRRMGRRGGARQRRQRCDDETAKLFEHRTRAQPGIRRISDRHGSRPHLPADKVLLDARLAALAPTLPDAADQEAQRLVAELKNQGTEPFDLIEGLSDVDRVSRHGSAVRLGHRQGGGGRAWQRQGSRTETTISHGDPVRRGAVAGRQFGDAEGAAKGGALRGCAARPYLGREQ